jgi:hypothetical protein
MRRTQLQLTWQQPTSHLLPCTAICSRAGATPDELMYLLVHHLDGALAGGPQTETTAEKPLLQSTLTWQVHACQQPTAMP